MIQAFKEGIDIHNKTATLIFHCPSDEVDSSMRRIAKTVNFGIVYGQTAFGLSTQLKISRKEATDFMDSYFASYPNIHQFMNSLIEQCKEKGYVETLFHRRRMIPEINDKNFMTREFGKRAAMNATNSRKCCGFDQNRYDSCYCSYETSKCKIKTSITDS